jgi:hypothetical protein
MGRIQDFLQKIKDSTPSSGSMDYLSSFSPEDQAKIRASWADPNMPQVNPNALGTFGRLTNEAIQKRTNIHQGQMQNQWYNNAVAAGSVPQPQPQGPAPNPALVSGVLNAFGGNAPSSHPQPSFGSAAPRQPQPSWTPSPAKVQSAQPAVQPASSYSSQYSDPYEEWKSQGRPGGTFAAWKASQGI